MASPEVKNHVPVVGSTSEVGRGTYVVKFAESIDDRLDDAGRRALNEALQKEGFRPVTKVGGQEIRISIENPNNEAEMIRLMRILDHMTGMRITDRPDIYSSYNPRGLYNADHTPQPTEEEKKAAAEKEAAATAAVEATKAAAKAAATPETLEKITDAKGLSEMAAQIAQRFVRLREADSKKYGLPLVFVESTDEMIKLGYGKLKLRSQRLMMEQFNPERLESYPDIQRQAVELVKQLNEALNKIKDRDEFELYLSRQGMSDEDIVDFTMR